MAAPGEELGGPLGRALDRWLQHLDSQGFRVGVRERLLIQTLLARQAAQGELPGDLHDMLSTAAPLVCGTREQQRHYGTLLQAFIASDGRLGEKADEGHERHPAAERPRRLKVMLAAGAGIAAVVAALWFAGVLPPHEEQVQAPAPPASAPARVEPPPGTATEAAVPFVVTPLPLPLQPDVPPSWSWPVRATIGVFAALALLMWAAALWLKNQRQLAMAGVRTDEELEEHLLRDVDPVDIAPHPVLARTVARALRQRVGGSGRTLDLPATVRATVAAQGAFTPSWRQLRLTPEYLALVDVRHPHDHHAAAVHMQLDALSRAGVALQVWHYESSPAAGCWLRGGQGNDDPLTRHRVPLAALATRSAGQRLLVFGTADVLQHPFTGLPQAWVSALLPLTERAWITPQPIHAWGAAERLADEAGFLVLPLQEASLTTLASWFTSRRLTLALDPDSPTSVPTQLQGKALEWVTRGDAPPPETRLALLRQLRAMLGGLRFQWLCGCAIFPALTPPLTLALGHRLLPDARSLALGLAAFCALPWFRWGRMPEWLRHDLLAELAPDIRARLAAEVHARLDRALESGSGPAVANVATRKRRLLGALQQRRGPLRDAVLADFVRKDTDPDLAQRLPEGLRRRLFKDGDPAQGLGVLAQGLAAAGVLALIVVATPLWPVMVGLSPQPGLTPLKSIAVGDAESPASAVRELRAFGETLMLAVRADGVASWTDFAPEATGILGAKFEAATLFDASLPLSNTAPEGTSLQIVDGRIQLMGADGLPRGAPLESDGAARVRLAGFSPSGGRVVALTDNGRWQSWGTRWPSHMEVVVACGGGGVGSSVASIVTRTLTPSTGGLDLNLVTFSSNGWRLPSFPASPAAGAVLRTEGYDSDRASTIAERLRGLSSRVPMPTWASPSVFTPAVGNLLVIGACSGSAEQPATPGESDKAAAASAPAGASSGQPASDDLVAMAAYFEGLKDGDPKTQELDAYVDAAGIWMIGYGHPLTRNSAFMRDKDYPDRSSALEGLTLTFGREVVKVSEGLTPDQARALLREDLANGLASVDSLVTVPLTRYQREALGDLVFNVGASTLRSSALLKLVNAGDFNAVPGQLQRWTVVAGKQVPGLARRRAAEIAMWEGKDWRSTLPKSSAK